MPSRRHLIAALTIAVLLSACGVRGDLEPPPGAGPQQEAEPQQEDEQTAQ